MTTTPFVLEVKADEARQLHEDLDLAVGHAIAQALKLGRCGILVTRHSYSRYSVSLDMNVPYGQIQELSLTTGKRY